jgi:hypothetical protein
MFLKGEPVGKDTLATWMSDLHPKLPEAWMFYTIVLQTPIPGAVWPSGWNPLTMKGLILLEGLYLGSHAAAAASVQAVQALGRDHQLECKVTTRPTFVEWHKAMFFADPGFPERTVLTSSLLADGPGLPEAAESIAEIVAAGVAESPRFDVGRLFFGVGMGGAVARGQNAVSQAFRRATMLVQVTSTWARPSHDAVERNWTHSLGAKIAAVEGVEGTYLNEADLDLPDYPRLFWGDTYPRLQAVKGAVDPANFFTCFQCVQPATPLVV